MNMKINSQVFLGKKRWLAQESNWEILIRNQSHGIYYLLNTHKIQNQRSLAGETNLTQPHATASCGCWDKLPSTGWLKTRGIFLSQKPEIKVLAGPRSLQGLSGRLVPCLFQLPAAMDIPCLVAAHSNQTSVLPWPSFSPCFLCSVHLDNPEWSYLDLLSFIIAAQILFPNKVAFTVSRMQCIFWGPIIQTATPYGCQTL